MNENNGDMFSRAISEKEDAQRRERMNDVLGKAYEEQQALLADSENAERADREFAAKKRNFMRNLMGVIVKRSGGGPISPRLATWANGVLQKAGVKDGGIMAGGGFGKDGRFVIPTYGMDANGAQVPGQGIAYDGKSLFTMMNQLRGIFSDDDISRGAEFLRKSGVGEKEIASMSYNPFATMLSDRDRARREMMTRQPTDPDHIKNRMGGGAGGREVGGTATFKGRDTRPHGVHAFGSDGNGGITRSDWTPEDGNTEENLGTRDPKYQGRWKVISSGPRRIKDAYVDENGQRHEAEYENGKRYVNDKTGEEVFVRDGETPPWSNGGMSEKERIARMQDAGKTERANAKNATSLTRADIEARLKEMGFNLKKEQLDGLMKYRESKLGQGASKDQAEAAAKELAAVRKSIEIEDDEKRKKELRARESQLQSVVDSFAGIGGGTEKPVSAADRFGSGGDKGTAPAAAPKGQETPAGGKPNGDAVQGNGGQREEPVRPSVKEEIITVDEYKKLPDDEKRKFRLRSNPKIKEGGYVYSRYVSIKQPASEESSEHSSAAQTKVEQRSTSSTQVQEPEKNGEQGGSEGKYGLRADGKTYKGTGWLGELKTADGGVATEYTSQSEAVKVDGKRIDFPTLVPTLTKDEVNLMVNDIIPNKKPVPDEIMQKAVDHANMRLSKGESVFANDGQPQSVGETTDRQTRQLTDDELLEKYKDDPRGKAFKGESRENHVARLRRIDEGNTLADQMGRLFDKAKPEVKRTASYLLKKLVKIANEPLISPETAEKVGSAIDPLRQRR